MILKHFSPNSICSTIEGFRYMKMQTSQESVKRLSTSDPQSTLSILVDLEKLSTVRSGQYLVGDHKRIPEQ